MIISGFEIDILVSVMLIIGFLIGYFRGYADTSENEDKKVINMEYNEERDLKVLLKYKDGLDLDPIDEPIVRNLCSIGFMKTGISFQRKQITARTVGIGLKLING